MSVFIKTVKGTPVATWWWTTVESYPISEDYIKRMDEDGTTSVEKDSVSTVVWTPFLSSNHEPQWYYGN